MTTNPSPNRKCAAASQTIRGTLVCILALIVGTACESQKSAKNLLIKSKPPVATMHMNVYEPDITGKLTKSYDINLERLVSTNTTEVALWQNNMPAPLKQAFARHAIYPVTMTKSLQLHWQSNHKQLAAGCYGFFAEKTNATLMMSGRHRNLDGYIYRNATNLAIQANGQICVGKDGRINQISNQAHIANRLTTRNMYHLLRGLGVITFSEDLNTELLNQHPELLATFGPQHGFDHQTINPLAPTQPQNQPANQTQDAFEVAKLPVDIATKFRLQTIFPNTNHWQNIASTATQHQDFILNTIPELAKDLTAAYKVAFPDGYQGQASQPQLILRSANSERYQTTITSGMQGQQPLQTTVSFQIQLIQRTGNLEQQPPLQRWQQMLQYGEGLAAVPKTNYLGAAMITQPSKQIILITTATGINLASEIYQTILSGQPLPPHSEETLMLGYLEGLVPLAQQQIWYGHQLPQYLLVANHNQANIASDSPTHADADSTTTPATSLYGHPAIRDPHRQTVYALAMINLELILASQPKPLSLRSLFADLGHQNKIHPDNWDFAIRHLTSKPNTTPGASPWLSYLVTKQILKPNDNPKHALIYRGLDPSMPLTLIEYRDSYQGYSQPRVH